MRSYDYAQRDGIRILSWDDCADLANRLAEDLAARRVELILGVARAGVIPAAEVAMALSMEFFPVRLSRRVGGHVRFDSPVWRVPIPSNVAGERVVVIDEIADTGESLELAREATLGAGAASVVTACLVSHSWADPSPDVASLISDELIIFPWGRRVYRDGKWHPDPELEDALRHQQRK